jgi:hypothetical protein
MIKRLISLGGAIACLSGCFQAGEPVKTETTDQRPAVPESVPVLRDEDNMVVDELPPEVLEDIKRQMLEEGQTSALKDLQSVYDFKTGTLLAPLNYHR